VNVKIARVVFVSWRLLLLREIVRKFPQRCSSISQVSYTLDNPQAPEDPLSRRSIRASAVKDETLDLESWTSRSHEHLLTDR